MRGKRPTSGPLVTPSRLLVVFLVLLALGMYVNYPTITPKIEVAVPGATTTSGSAGASSLRPPFVGEQQSSASSGALKPLEQQQGVASTNTGGDSKSTQQGFKLEQMYPPKQKRKVAYAITVTKDGPFVDGALVLGYAAKKVHDFNKGYNSGYTADLIAFVVPSVVTTRPILEKFGWKIIERSLPVSIDEIENREYAEAMRNSGCCGADEFLKLWAYTLTDYHRVVHLDMDSIIFKNMDELYSIDKEMLFTGDYNMMGSAPVPPAQGGFLVVRPSLERFEELRSIIRKGDYSGRTGWGGSKIGNFWGGQTIQGIVPYFYHSVHNGDAMELNRCVYNCMVDNPYRPDTKICLDRQSTCEDCRLQVPEKVSSAHFTICQKPWTCTEHVNPRNKVLCQALHEKWFKLRDEFEKEIGVDLSYRAQSTRYGESMGMCKGFGDRNYLPIPIPK